MPEKHILLLPSENYWEWVGATQDYVFKYGVNLTPDPDAAGGHLYPGQTVTIVAPSHGYPAQGDIKEWFKEHFPEALLDFLDAPNPSALRSALEDRVQKDDRFGERSSSAQIWESEWFSEAPIQLQWPTDYARITQAFGKNPEIYAYWGLPGHEGLDIRAPLNSNIYACADGEVYATKTDLDDRHPYGRHVRIRHANGYRTVYAHLAKVLVSKGEKVKAKQRIGLSDSTGNSSGSHLHLTLKRDGATLNGFTHYPKDVLDPTPFLLFPGEDATAAAYPWPQAKCLIGVNARPDGSFSKADFDIVDAARLEAVRVGAECSDVDITRLKQLNPAIFLMSFLHTPFNAKDVSVADWISRMRPVMKRHYKAGMRYFEVHRAPNLQSEGWGYSWRSGSEFARWWLDIVNALKEDYPEAKFGFPGLSAGEQIEGQRMDVMSFLEGADAALLNADWIGVQAYWASETEMHAEDKGSFFREMRRNYPEKMLFLTELGNVNALTNLAVKGKEYVEFFKSIRHSPGVGAAFAQVLSSNGPYSELAWRSEDGKPTDIVAEIKARVF
jgi:murein DD-endopeptidase MepM/ murein hydrolase activator NlpD